MSGDPSLDLPGDPGRSQQYDRAMRSLARAAPETMCEVLGIRPSDAIESLSESFPARTRVPDQVLRIGPNRLLHLEFARRGERSLTPRMLVYRGLIMEQFPADHLKQGVIVLGEGRLAGFDNLGEHGFVLDLDVFYLREQDPGRFLAHHELAPLAVLGRGSTDERATALTRALILISQEAGNRAGQLIEAAWVMATITLPRTTINQAARETGMSMESFADFYRDTEIGQALIRKVQQEVRQEGREEGRQELIADLLRERFGERDEIELLSRRLAQQSSSGALKAISEARTIRDLLP